MPPQEGVAIVGGFVYRGHEVEALRGRYVFGDYSTEFFSSDGRLFTAAVWRPGQRAGASTARPRSTWACWASARTAR